MLAISKKVNLTILNVAVVVLCLLITLISVLLANVSIETTELASRRSDTSIVRLHDIKTGRFFCSGVLISSKLLLTAAHCVVQDFGFAMIAVERVEVRTSNGKPIGLIAKLINASPRQDIALLSGDFRGMNTRPVLTNASEINKRMFSTRILACGYPDAGPLRCSPISRIGRMAFFFTGMGWLYPGMSGGPVLDAVTGEVLGVNTAVTETGLVVLSPAVELYDMLDLNEAPAK